MVKLKPRHLARSVAKAHMKECDINMGPRDGWFARNWKSQARMRLIEADKKNIGLRAKMR